MFAPDGKKKTIEYFYWFTKRRIIATSPQAITTKALIVVSGANDCTLAAALEKVVTPEQVRLGKECPFSVLCTTCLFHVYANAISTIKPGKYSLAAQLMKQSKTWKSRKTVLEEHYFGKKPEELEQCDINSAASHVLIFECIDDGAEKGKNNYGIELAYARI